MTELQDGKLESYLELGDSRTCNTQTSVSPWALHSSVDAGERDPLDL